MISITKHFRECSLLGVLMLTACAFNQRMSDPRIVPERVEEKIGSTIKRFWDAGAKNDSIVLRALVESDLPLRWAFGIDSLKPGFFERTAGSVRIVQAAYTGRDESEAWVEFEVPWVTCKPPAHDGKKDRYQGRMRLRAGTWKIVEFAGRIC